MVLYESFNEEATRTDAKNQQVAYSYDSSFTAGPDLGYSYDSMAETQLGACSPFAPVCSRYGLIGGD